jgi:hypothetical protein
MKRVIRGEDNTLRCPQCGSAQLVSRKTLKGMVADGIIFAPVRLKCVGCSKTLKKAA